MQLMFNQDFIIPDELKDTVIRADSHKADDSRVLKNEVDLNRFMEFELIRGANDSALFEEIEYVVEISQFTARSMTLKLNFSDPLSISTGREPDIFRAKIIQPNLFISKQSGKTVKKDTTIEV